MKLIFQIFAFIVSINSLFAKGIVNLEGRISKKYDGCKVTLSYKDQTNPAPTTIIKNGRFQLAAKLLNDFELVYLVFERSEKNIGAVNFFTAPGKIMANITTKDGLISPNDISLTNTAFVKEKKSYEAIHNEMADTLLLLYNKLSILRKENLQNSKYDSLLAVYHSKQRKILEQQIIFFKTYSNEYISLYYFHEAIFDNTFFRYPADSLFLIYNQFDPQLRSTALGKLTLDYLLKLNSLLLQSEMPDFSIKTFDGETFQLSSFREKQYVLLCFWASWCGPCIKSFPLLKEMDSLYSNKGLKMVSISIDTDSTKWFNSLKKHNLTWMQGCDLVPYVQQDKTIRPLYNLRFIPQYFLVNKEGRLIYHNLQLNDNDDFTVLQTVLNKIFQ